ncbi:MAG: hypothetical protein ACFFBL_09575 [Promethearchaeota archaeon]
MPLEVASIIMIFDLIIAMIIAITDPTVSVLLTASGYLFLEFGLMLILGACFMARQPLDVNKRYDKEGQPVRTWVWAMRGKKIFIASVFVLMFAVFISSLGMLF